MNDIYTIGHSSYTTEYFLQLLRLHNINCIVDVRSTPYSRHVPQFNKDEIKKFLNSKGIYYIFMGEELGARREDRSLYKLEGCLDFEKVRKTNIFQSGIERVKSGMEKGFNIALMCTEKDPIDCHRNILVGREFHIENYRVNNILSNGKIQTQEYIEKRLLDMYFPDRIQQTLFSTVEQSTNEKDLIGYAYRLRNKDIGYSIPTQIKESVVVSEALYNRVY